MRWCSPFSKNIFGHSLGRNQQLKLKAENDFVMQCHYTIMQSTSSTPEWLRKLAASPNESNSNQGPSRVTHVFVGQLRVSILLEKEKVVRHRPLLQNDLQHLHTTSPSIANVERFGIESIPASGTLIWLFHLFCFEFFLAQASGAHACTLKPIWHVWPMNFYLTMTILTSLKKRCAFSRGSGRKSPPQGGPTFVAANIPNVDLVPTLSTEISGSRRYNELLSVTSSQRGCTMIYL